MAVQVGAGGIWVALAALGGAAVYLLTPEGERNSENISDAMKEGGKAALDQLSKLIYPEKKIKEESLVDEDILYEDDPGCPYIPYIHYTSKQNLESILISGRFWGRSVYFSDALYGRNTVWNTLFNGNYLYLGNAHSFISIVVNCTVPIYFLEAKYPMNEYRHNGGLRIKAPHVLPTAFGENVFPEHPIYA